MILKNKAGYKIYIGGRSVVLLIMFFFNCQPEFRDNFGVTISRVDWGMYGEGWGWQRERERDTYAVPQVDQDTVTSLDMMSLQAGNQSAH